MAQKGRTLTVENNPVEQAIERVQVCRDRIEDLEATQRELEGEREEHKSELAVLEDSAGERALDGGKMAVIAKGLNEQRALVELTEKTLEALKVKQEAANKELAIAQASKFRAKAADLWATVQERRKVTDKLLKKLQDFEGCPYDPRLHNADPRLDAMGLWGIQAYSQTKTSLLIMEVRGLEKQAEGFERAAGVPSPPSVCGERVLVPVAAPMTPPAKGKISYTKIHGHPVYENIASP